MSYDKKIYNVTITNYKAVFCVI